MLTILREKANIISAMSLKDQVTSSRNFNIFLATYAVFTVDDVRKYLSEHGSTNANTRKALLTYHRSRGRIVPIRRGLYASVPPNKEPDKHLVDPFLVAAKMTDDAVLAYHTALEYHGKAYTGYNRLTYVSRLRSHIARFGGYEYVRVPVPYSLLDSGDTQQAIETHRRDSVDLRVTNLERTFVDVLDRPEISGSWEEIWRSLESIEFFDLVQVVEYLKHLGNATTAAKVGFFLSQHRDALMVGDETFVDLKEMIPKQPHYMDRGNRSGCRLVPEWNLLVPPEILKRSWEEIL